MQKYCFTTSVLVRKEHFGTLIFLFDGRRFIIDNRYFPLIEYLRFNPTFSEIRKKFPEFQIKEIRKILGLLLKKGIVGFNSKFPSPKIRIVKNEFISKTCLSFPRVIYWECTLKCNYKCIHCYSFSSKASAQKEMCLSTVKKLIEEIAEKGAEFLSIGGGEPLLYPHLFSVIRFAKEKGIEVEISTNGSLLTKENLKRLKESGLRYLQISLNAADEKIHSKITQRKNFRKIIENIKKAKREGFIVSICTTLMKLNIEQIFEIINLSANLKCNNFRAILLQEIGRAKENLEKIYVEKNKLKKTFEKLMKMRETRKDIEIYFNPNILFPLQKNIPWLPETYLGCSAGRTLCGIDAYGNVYPCLFLRSEKFNCGNIKEKTLSEIWKNAYPMKLLRNLKKIEGKCAQCPFLEKCGGGCRALAYNRTNNIFASDPLCIAQI